MRASVAAEDSGAARQQFLQDEGGGSAVPRAGRVPVRSQLHAGGEESDLPGFGQAAEAHHRRALLRAMQEAVLQRCGLDWSADAQIPTICVNWSSDPTRSDRSPTKISRSRVLFITSPHHC